MQLILRMEVQPKLRIGLEDQLYVKDGVPQSLFYQFLHGSYASDDFSVSYKSTSWVTNRLDEGRVNEIVQ